jgi:methylmalonyl-CoA/ethylmalonyl-CoA epimerase
MEKIEHLGIAVKDLKAANKVYESLFGYTHYKTETIESEGVRTSFFKCGDNKIELLEATTDNKLVVFIHPKSTNGVLIELCQEINNEK